MILAGSRSRGDGKGDAGTLAETRTTGQLGTEAAVERNRLLLPAWGISLILHLLLFSTLTAFTMHAAQGLPRETTIRVGLEVGPDPPPTNVLDGADSALDDTRSGDGQEAGGGEKTGHGFDDPGDNGGASSARETSADTAALPVLATAGAALNEVSKVMPQAAAGSLGGGGPGGGRSRTRFFSAEAVGKSFLFVIDRSASMSYRDAIGAARRELLRCLEHLTPDSSFQVIFYNTEPEIMPLGGQKLVKATHRNLDHTKEFLQQMTASGGTVHDKALFAAFALHPEVIYFLTDADDMSVDDVRRLTLANRQGTHPATIYTIEFGTGPNLAGDKPLRRLAQENDGTYTYVNVQEFRRTP